MRPNVAGANELYPLVRPVMVLDAQSRTRAACEQSVIHAASNVTPA